MKLAEYSFTEYYHQYVTIEADDLTEQLKENIKVHDNDCYALCSCYVAKDGYLEFNVLSIGSTWENCTRGLGYKKMLGIFEMEQVYDREARIVEPDYAMIHKNTPWLEAVDRGTDDDLLTLRKDPRLDPLRDPLYPDHVLTGVIHGQSLYELDMRITGVRGPFLVGTLVEEPGEDLGVHRDDPLWALPYYSGDGCRLFALFAGDDLSDDQIKARDRILAEMEKIGLGFNGISIKS